MYVVAIYNIDKILQIEYLEVILITGVILPVIDSFYKEEILHRLKINILLALYIVFFLTLFFTVRNDLFHLVFQKKILSTLLLSLFFR